MGSSRRRRSGWERRRRQSATRRRSPPESVVTSESPGGQRSASMAISSGALDLPAVAGVDLLLQLGLLGHERVHVGVGVGEAFGDGVEAVEQLLGLADAVHDVAEHVLGLVEMRLLLEVADLDAVGGPGLAVEVLVAAGHDLQEARLARAVDAEHADLGAGEEGQGDVLEQLLATRENLGELLHDEDVLIGGHRRPFSGRWNGMGWAGRQSAAWRRGRVYVAMVGPSAKPGRRSGRVRPCSGGDRRPARWIGCARGSLWPDVS